MKVHVDTGIVKSRGQALDSLLDALEDLVEERLSEVDVALMDEELKRIVEADENDASADDAVHEEESEPEPEPEVEQAAVTKKTNKKLVAGKRGAAKAPKDKKAELPAGVEEEAAPPGPKTRSNLKNKNKDQNLLLESDADDDDEDEPLLPPALKGQRGRSNAPGLGDENEPLFPAAPRRPRGRSNAPELPVAKPKTKAASKKKVEDQGDDDEEDVNEVDVRSKEKAKKGAAKEGGAKKGRKKKGDAK
jgi:hypothetical protein